MVLFVCFMKIKGWRLGKWITLLVVNSRSQFHWNAVRTKQALLQEMVHEHHFFSWRGSMCHRWLRNDDDIHLPMELWWIRINWIFIKSIYYSTQNGFISSEVSFLSGSRVFNHYCWHEHVLKMANFFRFKWHKTTFSTESGNVIAIWIQFTFIAGTIGILVYVIKYGH